MKRLEILQFFADAHELDRFARDRFEAQGRAAARIAVEPGENRAGDLQRLIKMRRDIDRFLAGGGVEHQQNLLRLHQVAQADQFLHERFVNLQTARGVEDERVAVVGPCECEGSAGDLQYVRFAPLEEDGQSELPSERFELVHRRRAVNVRSHQ